MGGGGGGGEEAKGLRNGLITTSSLSYRLTTLPLKLNGRVKLKDINKLAFIQVPDLLSSLCKCQERMRLIR